MEPAAEAEVEVEDAIEMGWLGAVPLFAVEELDAEGWVRRLKRLRRRLEVAVVVVGGGAVGREGAREFILSV